MGTSENHHIGESGPLSIALQVRAERLTHLQARVAMPAIVGALFSLLPVVLLWSHLPAVDLIGWLLTRWGISSWRVLDAGRFLKLPLVERARPHHEHRYLAVSRSTAWPGASSARCSPRPTCRRSTAPS